jgi:hypothetical protein
MALQYVFDTDVPLRRVAVASGETITEGEFISLDSNGEAAQFDPANDDLPQGIVVHNPRGDSIVEHDEDYVQYEDLWTYDGSEGDRLYYAPLRQVDVVLPRVIDEQTSPSSTEPDVSAGTVVGIVNLGSGETRIVPSGYTYDGTTYSETGTGDFIALGRVDHSPTGLKIDSTYGNRVPVRMDADVFQP